MILHYDNLNGVEVMEKKGKFDILVSIQEFSQIVAEAVEGSFIAIMSSRRAETFLDSLPVDMASSNYKMEVFSE